jgi:alpha-ketoglutarate-dependent taurine dioxygenase
MDLETVNLSPRIGVEIKTDAATLLGGAHAPEIRRLLDRHGVVIARGIDFDDTELVAFARTLGAIHTNADGDIFKVTLDEKENRFSKQLYNSAEWHMDRMDSDLPPLGSMLVPRVLPPQGGETEFANTYAAYEELPESEQRRLETLQSNHLPDSLFGEDPPYWPRWSDDRKADMIRKWGRAHPLVWRHRSGRTSLVLGRTMNDIAGMDREAGKALIRRLVDLASKPENVYRHHWRMGDLVIWDNTGTMHRVRPFDESSGRRLHRVTLLGEEPVTGVSASTH